MRYSRTFELPDAAPRRVIVQDSVAVKPLDDAVLHLHRYMTHNAL